MAIKMLENDIGLMVSDSLTKFLCVKCHKDKPSLSRAYNTFIKIDLA